VNGQAIKQDFLVIRNNPLVSNPSFAIPENSDCCFELLALAETTFTDKLKNDKHSWIQWYDKGAFTTAKLTLQKWNGSDFADVADLEDDTYGTNFPFAFYETIYDENAIGYLVDWQKVLTEEGEGNYRLKSTGVQVAGPDVLNYSFEFCLHVFTPYRADKSIRFEWYKNGNQGSLSDDERRVDYGHNNWYNSIRLRGYFGDDTSEQETSFVKYHNGNEVWTGREQFENYTLKLNGLPVGVHRFIKFDALPSDNVYITDYNLNNATPHIMRKVIWDSSYEPKWTRGTMLAMVDITLRQGTQNHTLHRS
jgi:hypothetical protein